MSFMNVCKRLTRTVHFTMNISLRAYVAKKGGLNVQIEAERQAISQNIKQRFISHSLRNEQFSVFIFHLQLPQLCHLYYKVTICHIIQLFRLPPTEVCKSRMLIWIHYIWEINQC